MDGGVDGIVQRLLLSALDSNKAAKNLNKFLGVGGHKIGEVPQPGFPALEVFDAPGRTDGYVEGNERTPQIGGSLPIEVKIFSASRF
ncbi:hypothetical protein [Phormidium sp. CCY1219]|uniref:hypothetical protein n=1 Tax=Phormidium sp. CCY1219 TaxID=2886104 RepID=UPI002D1F0166|nr:hypothetical protein [Phormidium sp. CCY1219]MEB3826223.1 hypothetical protein [Phormidium sp. CCY1219]